MIGNIEHLNVDNTNPEITSELKKRIENKFINDHTFFQMKLNRNTLHQKSSRYYDYRYQKNPILYRQNDVKKDLFFNPKMRLKRQAITVTQSVDGTTSTTFNITPLIYRVLLEVVGPIFSQVIGGVG